MCFGQMNVIKCNSDISRLVQRSCYFRYWNFLSWSQSDETFLPRGKMHLTVRVASPTPPSDGCLLCCVDIELGGRRWSVMTPGPSPILSIAKLDKSRCDIKTIQIKELCSKPCSFNQFEEVPGKQFLTLLAVCCDHLPVTPDVCCQSRRCFWWSITATQRLDTGGGAGANRDLHFHCNENWRNAWDTQIRGYNDPQTFSLGKIIIILTSISHEFLQFNLKSQT